MICLEKWLEEVGSTENKDFERSESSSSRYSIEILDLTTIPMSNFARKVCLKIFRVDFAHQFDLLNRLNR